MGHGPALSSLKSDPISHRALQLSLTTPAGQRTGVHWGPWSAGSSQEGAAQPPQDLQHRKQSWSASETAPVTQPQQVPPVLSLPAMHSKQQVVGGLMML